jgi:hypothetical protein
MDEHDHWPGSSAAVADAMAVDLNVLKVDV